MLARGTIGRSTTARWTVAAVAALAGIVAIFGVDDALGQSEPVARPDADSDFPQDGRWPHEFSRGGDTSILVYQPQIESWDDHKTIEALAAVMITKSTEDGDVAEEDLGAITITAQTATDHSERLVTLRDITITKATFPGVTDATKAAGLEKVVRRIFPKGPVEVSLDRMLANVQRTASIDEDVPVSRQPPKIILHDSDAILVTLDGEPVFEPIEGTSIELAINTTSNLFHYPPTGTYYVLRDVHWLEATDLAGPWKVNRLLPDGFFRLPKNPRFKDVRTRVRARSFSTIVNPPAVFVAGEPTELIVTYGKPEFESIPGTKLHFVSNSDSDLFKYDGDGMYYALLSGRWFRTPEKAESLELCTTDLPDDFAKIPPDHAAGRVLVAVPGTQHAREAVLAAAIPRTATISRSDVSAEVSYEGDPVFEAIEGTTVERAVNTSQDVFRVDGRYYLCLKAVWFVADAPTGPWTVCDDVPDALYTIPPNDPAFPVTFVRVYDSSSDDVVAGYLPGYENLYVSDGVVVYGLGYDYYYPASYYRDLYRSWRRGHFRYMRLHDTYGHGHYYDHLSGRFERSADVRSHQAAADILGDPYAAWDGAGVTASAFNERVSDARLPRGPGAPLFHGPAYQGRTDLYAARNGDVYRRQGEAWQRHGSGGWSGGRPPARVRQAATGRTWGMQRRSQYRQYRSSRFRSGGHSIGHSRSNQRR